MRLLLILALAFAAPAWGLDTVTLDPGAVTVDPSGGGVPELPDRLDAVPSVGSVNVSDLPQVPPDSTGGTEPPVPQRLPGREPPTDPPQ